MDQIARRHLADVDRRIAQLTLMRNELQRMINTCGHDQVAESRIIEALADHSQCDHARR